MRFFLKSLFFTPLYPKDDSKFRHKVIHYHYIKWPDKSVPECGYELIQLLKYVNNFNGEGKDDLILVHCR